MSAPDATPARWCECCALQDTYDALQVQMVEERAAHKAFATELLSRAATVARELTAERDALAQRVAALEGGPDDATCRSVFVACQLIAHASNSVPDDDVFSAIRNALRATPTPEAKDA